MPPLAASGPTIAVCPGNRERPRGACDAGHSKADRGADPRQREYDGGMKTTILVGTGAGLWEVDEDGGAASLEPFAGRDITAVVGDGRRIVALADGRSIWTTDGDGRWRSTASVDGPAATCLAVSGEELFVGTEQAHLWRLTGAALEPARALEAGTALEPVTAFEFVDGRAAWYTPWGDPADVRSIAVDRGEALYVNVHVG